MLIDVATFEGILMGLMDTFGTISSGFDVSERGTIWLLLSMVMRGGDVGIEAPSMLGGKFVV